MTTDDERIALFLDYENLAIGAREALGRPDFDFRPIADALAERGRVVVRRAYADWSSFADDRRELTRHQIELIEIPQRMGAVRKNAADIKMAVDAIELCLEREYITTFVLGTGDSDFTPLVHKLRELNRRVIGVGIEASTSALLPPACDEFLFYERLEGVEPPTGRRSARGRTRRAARPAAESVEVAEPTDGATPAARPEDTNLGVLVTQTLAGLERTSSGPVLASMLKRTILRKDPTFNEADHGFRGFGELLRQLASTGVIELREGTATGDPEVHFPLNAHDEEAAFALLRATVERLAKSKSGPPHLSGLKTQMRRSESDFSEKRFGYGGFLQFAKAARARGLVDMEFDEQADDYVLRPA
jgi:uncharacterized protein (TIGR00288 family)